MLVRRPLGILLAAVALTVGVVSATSLGSFSDIAFSAFADEQSPCTYEDATLMNSLTGALPLSVPGIYSIDSVQLTGLTGACAGMTPVVVTIGQDPWGSDDQVLAIEDYPGTDLSGATATINVLAGDALDLLTLDLTTVVTEVRVAFCPAGATCT